MRQLMAQICDERIRSIKSCDITVEEETRSEAPLHIEGFRAAVGNARLAGASPSGKPENALPVGGVDPGADVAEELLSRAVEARLHLVKPAGFKIPTRESLQKRLGIFIA